MKESTSAGVLTQNNTFENLDNLGQGIVQTKLNYFTQKKYR